MIPSFEALLATDAAGRRSIDSRLLPRIDPWGNPYQIQEHPEHPGTPLVLSWGPDRIEDSEDDVTSAPAP